MLSSVETASGKRRRKVWKELRCGSSRLRLLPALRHYSSLPPSRDRSRAFSIFWERAGEGEPPTAPPLKGNHRYAFARTNAFMMQGNGRRRELDGLSFTLTGCKLFITLELALLINALRVKRILFMRFPDKNG